MTTEMHVDDLANFESQSTHSFVREEQEDTIDQNLKQGK